MANDKKPDEKLPDPEHELNPDVYRAPDADTPPDKPAEPETPKPDKG